MRPRLRHTTLCYHGVSAAWNDPLAVRPEAFEAQVRSLLRRGLRAVGAEQALHGGQGTFHVTFDDAYTSIRPALRLLADLGVPATVFVCSAYAADGGLLLLPELQGRSEGHVQELETMSWAALREVAAQGPVEIGSHTMTHPHLPVLSDDELVTELRKSRTAIEEGVGRPCRFVAYPYGENDEAVRVAARDAGYTGGFGLFERPEPLDPFALPRVDVYRATGALRFRTRTSSLDPAIRAVSATVRGARPARGPR